MMENSSEISASKTERLLETFPEIAARIEKAEESFLLSSDDEIIRVFSEFFLLHADFSDTLESAKKIIEILGDTDTEHLLVKIVLYGPYTARCKVIPVLFNLFPMMALPLLIGFFVAENRKFELRKISLECIIEYIRDDLFKQRTITSETKAEDVARTIFELLDAEIRIEAQKDENDPDWCPFLFRSYLLWRSIVGFDQDVHGTLQYLFENSKSRWLREWSASAMELFETNQVVIDIDLAASKIFKSTQNRLLRVFLCHASQDKPRAREIYHRLHSKGIDPWLDEEKLLPGQNWKYEITKAVRNADVVIICLSTNSVGKEGFVQWEIKHALDIADEKPEGSIFLIPLKLEECDVPERLSHLQCVNYFDERGFNRLLRALKARADDLDLPLEGNFET